MADWVLILFVYAGAFSKGDSVALTQVDGFVSEAACNAAGSQTSSMTSGTIKSSKFVCIRREKVTP